MTVNTSSSFLVSQTLACYSLTKRDGEKILVLLNDLMVISVSKWIIILYMNCALQFSVSNMAILRAKQSKLNIAYSLSSWTNQCLYINRVILKLGSNIHLMFFWNFYIFPLKAKIKYLLSLSFFHKFLTLSFSHVCKYPCENWMSRQYSSWSPLL